MTNEEKKTVLLFRQSGKTYSAIADTTGLSINTIKAFCRRNQAAAEPEVTAENGLCRFCGKPVRQLPGHKVKKFCSDACRNKWWNAHLDEVKRDAMDECVCPVCGKTFYAYPKRHRKYCSHACYIKGRYGGAE